MRILTIITALLFLTGCCEKAEKAETVKSLKGIEGTVIIAALSADTKNELVSIPTVQCGMCDMNITVALETVPGIQEFLVNIDDLNVQVLFDGSTTSLKKVEEAISKVGYQANQTKADPAAYKALMGCCKLPKDRQGSGMM